MYSNGRMIDFPKHDTESVNNSEELEEIRLAALESSTNQFPVSPKICSSLEGIREFSTIATQTSLTLIRFTLMQASSDEYFVDSTTSPMHFNQESIYGNTKPLSCTLVRDQTSIAINHEAATQATPLHPSLIHSRFRISSHDILQISSTSFSSNKSGPRNEVLTVTTDYSSQLPDAHSILVDAIDQNDTYGVSRTLDLALSNLESARNNFLTRETNRRLRSIMRSLNNCLRCISATNNEPDTHPYMRDAPPTYSTIYANRATTMRSWRPLRSTNQFSFTAQTPLPSYAQAQGICLASYSMDHLLSVSPNANRLWSPRPTTAVCPRCTTIVVTTIEVRQSIITHITALALFLCGCWLCCMIPYCMNSCKNIDHYCPICRAYLGTYRLW